MPWLLCLQSFLVIVVLFRGLSAPEAEMLYMQEVEKMDGYGQESYQAKVSPPHKEVNSNVKSEAEAC